MKIIINDQANLKLNHFVDLVTSEISGMAKSKYYPKEDVIYITDFMIFTQEVTGSTTLITDESIAKFTYELMKANEKTEEWNVWWHSHVDMEVFWSGTDETTIEEHTAQGHLISIVTNKKREYKARLDIFPKDTSPFKKASFCTFNITEIEVEENEKLTKEKEKYLKLIEKATEDITKLEEKYTDNKKIEAFCQKEIDAKVKSKSIGFVNNWSNWNKKDYSGYEKQDHLYLPTKKEIKKWTWFDSNYDRIDIVTNLTPRIIDAKDDLDIIDYDSLSDEEYFKKIQFNKDFLRY